MTDDNELEVEAFRQVAEQQAAHAAHAREAVAADEGDRDAPLLAKLAGMINSALTNHASRSEKRFKAMLDEAVRAPAKSSAAGGPGGQALAEELAAARAELKQERASRSLQAVKEVAYAEMAKKGIVGPRAVALLAYLRDTERLTLDEEGSSFAVARVRNKGAPAEEVIHTDFAAGFADWSASAEAAEFLPAPVGGQRPPLAPRPMARPRLAPSDGRDEPLLSESEMARRTLDQLNRAGIDVDRAIDGDVDYT